MTKVSPLAPERFPEMPPVGGVRLATGAAGVRYRGRDDLLLVELAAGTSAAGVLTRSATAAAPVGWCRKALAGGEARALVVNAGNANAFTGRAGEEAVQRTVAATSEMFRCVPERVFVASTGVIGEAMPVERIVSQLPLLRDRLGNNGWETAARAIATTDTFVKGSTRRAVVDGVDVTINGVAKGSGMIAPDMATMLVFLFTDAAVGAKALQAVLTRSVAGSFNCITVDSDTSTNDTALLFATGAAGNVGMADPDDPRLTDFRLKLDEVTLNLAHQIVRDGEGATKFVTIAVRGAEDDEAARRIGLAVANSPLVKTAIAGEDANWGRIVMAAGKSKETIDPNRLAIDIGGVAITRDGGVVPGYDETPVAAHMKGREVEIAVDVGVGPGHATVWTCDLTHGYIDVNASYRS